MPTKQATDEDNERIASRAPEVEPLGIGPGSITFPAPEMPDIATMTVPLTDGTLIEAQAASVPPEMPDVAAMITPNVVPEVAVPTTTTGDGDGDE